ncbi:MAG: glycoside hydrolase family 15 protein, partial [Bacteroidales bacterium]|nr:glycoside hydrolase family 15 protein [Bacteroidales bacterium]
MDNLNYGIIGNCKSAALISDSGSIDWCCLPEFDSSSVFAKILDEEKGGSFEILVSDDYKIKQYYLFKTNILCTSFSNGNDAFELLDFMPRYKEENGSHYQPPDIIRYIKLVSGKPVFSVKYLPRLEYAQHPVKITFHKKYIKTYTTKGDYDSLYLYTDIDHQKIVKSEKIEILKDSFFLISYNQKLLPQNIERANLKMERTKVYWLNWSERTTHYLEYQDEVMRSALVLKLLSFEKSGAVLAAVTTSLPETIGEVRNWDYRFCWLRDASMVVKVMTDLGHLTIARRYIRFIIDIMPDKDEEIQIMYGINREKKLKEEILEHLSGYKDSFPVRIGNAAYKQKQHDIYGILMDVIYQHFMVFHTSLDYGESLWTITRSVVKLVKRNWKKPDRGIWEIRTEQKHFTFSKVLCWTAIDRAIKIAELIKMDSYIKEWTKLANTIKADIMEKAWNEKAGAFTQYYGSDDLDASNLLMETYGFIDAKDPKYISTVLATQKDLGRDGLMYRYKNKDDFGLPSSSFTICTFWLINSLGKIGRKKEARQLFDQLLSYSNHLGLFSEDIDFETKRLLGNFPQAYSHLA